ncbi:hypothetical protein ACQY0O_007573 [Thecaphora frezii]
MVPCAGSTTHGRRSTPWTCSAGRQTSSAPRIFGNFSRYYHIRNPASAEVADDGLSDSHPVQDDSAAGTASKLDPRVPPMVAFLEKQLWPDQSHEAGAARPRCRILDIGCNSGKVTIELAQELTKRRPRNGAPDALGKVLGVDIDPGLVKEAQYSASLAWSRCRPSWQVATASTDDVSSAMQPFDYFPDCFPHLFGHLPTPFDDTDILRKKNGNDPSEPNLKKRKDEKEHDSSSAAYLAFSPLQFLAAEWVNADIDAARLRHGQKATRAHAPNRGQLGGEGHGSSVASASAAAVSGAPLSDAGTLMELECHDREGYSAVVCLALTKWIHVHHGDGGMMRLFARIVRSLRPGGCLLLERQPWKSYEEVRRMGSEMRAKMSGLQLRPDGDFEWILESLGLTCAGRIGDGPGTGFVRHIDAFVKPHDPLPPSAESMADTFLNYRTQSEAGELSPSGMPWVMRYPRRGIRSTSELEEP